MRRLFCYCHPQTRERGSPPGEPQSRYFCPFLSRIITKKGTPDPPVGGERNPGIPTDQKMRLSEYLKAFIFLQRFKHGLNTLHFKNKL